MSAQTGYMFYEFKNIFRWRNLYKLFDLKCESCDYNEWCLLIVDLLVALR